MIEILYMMNKLIHKVNELIYRFTPIEKGFRCRKCRNSKKILVRSHKLNGEKIEVVSCIQCGSRHLEV